MPISGASYPNPGRYWGFLKETLVQVFGISDTDAGDIVTDLEAELKTASEDEQLIFYHSEPIEVASKLSGVPSVQPLGSARIGAYERLVNRLVWTP